MTLRAVGIALWDTFKMWNRVELCLLVFKTGRGYWRWTRNPLGDRERLLWTKFMYEVVSGYGEGETEHLFPPGRYPRWFRAGQSW